MVAVLGKRVPFALVVLAQEGEVSVVGGQRRTHPRGIPFGSWYRSCSVSASKE
jgi:hypothetical protein